MTPSFDFGRVTAEDFEDLLALRVAVMRVSLERIGRYDPQRARERFRTTFRPADTRRILVGGTAAGCVATWAEPPLAWRIEHFYLAPDHQGQGLGSAVMARLLASVPAGVPVVRVAALHQSAANRFYERHGFRPVVRNEFDIEYERPAG